MPGFLRKLGWLTTRSRREAELREALEFHLEEEIEKGKTAGLTEAQARAAARRELGNPGLIAEDTRSAWSWPLLTLVETIFGDVRYGARMLARNTKVTVLTVLALALGIGVNASVFTAYKALWLMPLDARDPHEMVNIALTRDSGPTNSFSYPDYEAYRDSLDSFSGLIASRAMNARLSSAGGPPDLEASLVGSGLGRLGLISPRISGEERARIEIVTENYFEVLGVAPVRGRSFESLSRAELQAQPSVLISENYWQRRFGGDPEIIGKTIRLNNVAVTVIGVTPHDFRGADFGAPPFWAPISIDPLFNRDDQWLNQRENQRYRLHGRLAHGVSMAQAQAEMNPIANQLRALHDPESISAEPASALVLPGSPLLPQPNNGMEVVIALIMFAAALVLAVACANVGSLQLARARSRQHELSTRLSLGASRLRVVRQLLTESVLVGLLAGVSALFLTWAFLQELSAQFAGVFPLWTGSPAFDVTPDFEIVGYVVAVSLFAGILAGLTPAMESSRSALAAIVRSNASSRRSRRLQDVLVAAQVSLSLILLIVAGMLIRTSFNEIKMPTGYDTLNVISLDFRFAEPSDYDADAKLAVAQELRTRLAALPGVSAMSSARPPGERRFLTAAMPIGEAAAVGNPVQSILAYTRVQENYFETIGVPLVLGRTFQQQGNSAVILSESAATELWPNQNPIGRSLRLGPTDEQHHRRSELVAEGPALQVVGVVRDKRGMALDGGGSREIYLALAGDQVSSRPILIRTQAEPKQVIDILGPVLTSIDPTISATANTLEERLRASPLFGVSMLFGAFASAIGTCALLLALMGIYGTVSYIVVLRTREIGIRRAIGAQRGDVIGLILRESTRPILIGLILGMPLSAGGVFLATRLLFGLSFVDIVSTAAVTVLFLSIALLASYFPARRAMGIDPLVALRHEG
ncbi:MAG: ABC transporter permease [Acidobacteria bacterium]|nr:ABC transporter permease [Acidobacteriota bacterium]MDA1234511.1 ABC transporter permease [Acidobacteriota bacterium]